jgi:hypothetical protein
VTVATAFYSLFSTKCRKSTVLQLLRVGLCESCYGFLRFFFNKMFKNTVLLRVGLQCSFDLNIFLVITGKNNILPKKMFITAFSHNDQKIVCFWLSRMLIV